MAHPVDISDLEEGMYIARDVFSKGQMLIQAGTLLTKQLISILERRDVSQVFIADGDDTGERQRNANTQVMVRRLDEQLGSRATEKLNKALAKVEAQFMGMEDDHVMGHLKVVATQHWAQRAMEAESDTPDKA